VVVVETPPPPPSDTYVRPERRSLYERYGIGLALGGGVEGYAMSDQRDQTTDGGNWDVRLTVGTRSPLALEASYIGSAQAINSFSAPDNRDALKTTWEQGLRELLRSAEAGSDHQLTFARAFAGAARSDAALAELEGLLDGSTVIDGLAIDTDLRWGLVTALAKEGRADADRIAEELERDNTISGQENAAAALASRPTAEAKAEAWELAMVRDDVPNETQRSIVLAFQAYGQDEVLLPYVEKYLAAAETMWEEKGTQRASTALEYIFPKQLASQELLDRVDQWLETSPANPAAKRYVREGRDDVARALRAQARDAQG
jgi:aminopeptidase N